MSAELQISSRENLAVPAKEWYLNVWIFVRNLLANKMRSVMGKGMESRKKGKQEKDYLVPDKYVKMYKKLGGSLQRRKDFSEGRL